MQAKYIKGGGILCTVMAAMIHVDIVTGLDLLMDMGMGEALR